MNSNLSADRRAQTFILNDSIPKPPISSFTPPLPLLTNWWILFWSFAVEDAMGQCICRSFFEEARMRCLKFTEWIENSFSFPSALRNQKSKILAEKCFVTRKRLWIERTLERPSCSWSSSPPSPPRSCASFLLPNPCNCTEDLECLFPLKVPPSISRALLRSAAYDFVDTATRREILG